jgi:hypothetical protein
MVFEASNPKKKKLKSIAVKYLCGKCGLSKFCLIDGVKTDCVDCHWDNCPTSAMYIFREEAGVTFACCVASEVMAKINKSIQEA